MQALHLQHRSPSSYRVKVRASYVDETLFGSPTGTRPTPPAFDPPWVQNCDRSARVGPGPPKVSLVKRDCESTPSRGSTPNLTPRKKNKYRLIGHTPSYCDESLFGSWSQGTNKEGSRTAIGDTAKLQTLFWTPPATPRDGHSPRPRRPHLSHSPRWTLQDRAQRGNRLPEDIPGGVRCSFLSGAEAFPFTQPPKCPQHGSSSFQCPPDQWTLESPAFHVRDDCSESLGHSQVTVRQSFRAICPSTRGRSPQAKASLEMRFSSGNPLAQVQYYGDQCLQCLQALDKPP